MRAISTLMVSGVLVLSLSACGGGGGGSGKGAGQTASNAPPASAAASIEGFIAYLQTLTADLGDGTLPVDVSTFVAPTSETADPSAL